MGLRTAFCQSYYKSTGYSYTHLGRLFLRMFIGLMLAQFGVRALIDGDATLGIIPGNVIGDFPEWILITVEIFCSFCIMIGFLMRLLIFPPLALMIVATAKIWFTYHSVLPSFMTLDMMTLPFMFIGAYIFLLIVGPGKISVDYFLSLYLINRVEGSEEDLEEV